MKNKIFEVLMDRNRPKDSDVDGKRGNVKMMRR